MNCIVRVNFYRIALYFKHKYHRRQEQCKRNRLQKQQEVTLLAAFNNQSTSALIGSTSRSITLYQYFCANDDLVVHN